MSVLSDLFPELCIPVSWNDTILVAVSSMVSGRIALPDSSDRPVFCLIWTYLFKNNNNNNNKYIEYIFTSLSTYIMLKEYECLSSLQLTLLKTKVILYLSLTVDKNIMNNRKGSVEIGWEKRDPDRLKMERATFIDGLLHDRLYTKPFTSYLIEVL